MGSILIDYWGNSSIQSGKETIMTKREREQARLATAIPMTVGEVEEIIAEMDSLIGMMDGYYSTGGCDEDARELMSRMRERIQNL